jgi:DNA-binding NarL/FixJ family response regulator
MARVRVLLADDYAGNLTGIQRLLGSWCEVVGVVSSAEAVVESARKLAPDVVVMDATLRDSDGIEACRRISQELPRTRIVIFTGFDDPALRQRAFAAGASAFVLKHRVAEDLATAIRHAALSGATAPPD